jgi:hypothetical protein
MNIDSNFFGSLPRDRPSFRVDRGWSVGLAALALTCVALTPARPCVAQTLGFMNRADLVADAARPTAFAEMAKNQPLLAVVAVSSSAENAALPDEGLPDEPQPQDPQQTKPLVAAVPSTVPMTTSKPVVGRYVKYIPADSAAPQIHGREKFILGARDLYSAGNFAAMIVSAGWEQVTNGSPNYGTDRGAFGERLGAAGIRETTEGIFTDGVFSVMLHEDPRYFVLGPRYGFVHRTLYAITRPLVTRNSSDGHRTINGGLLLGYAASTALTNAYYPQINRNLRDNISSYGGSIGGAALGFAIDEFYDQAMEAVHLKKRP